MFIDKVNTPLSGVTPALCPPSTQITSYNLCMLQICVFMSLKMFCLHAAITFSTKPSWQKKPQLCIYTRDFWTRTTALTDFQGPQRPHVHKRGLNGAQLVGLFFPADKGEPVHNPCYRWWGRHSFSSRGHKGKTLNVLLSFYSNVWKLQSSVNTNPSTTMGKRSRRIQVSKINISSNRARQGYLSQTAVL